MKKAPIYGIAVPLLDLGVEDCIFRVRQYMYEGDWKKFNWEE